MKVNSSIKLLCAALICCNSYCSSAQQTNEIPPDTIIQKRNDSLYLVCYLTGNSIKTNVLGFARGNLSLYYERHLFNNCTVEAGGGINLAKDHVLQDVYPSVFSDDSQPGAALFSLFQGAQRTGGGSELGARAKYYFGRSPRSNGFYIGYSYHRYSYNLRSKGLPASYLKQSYRDDMATNIEFSIREDGYFRRDEQFRINNAVHGLIFGLKEQWKTPVKYQYDVFLCLGPTVIRTNQIQKDGSISQGTYWLVKSDQMYSIKRFWFSLNFLAGIGW